MSVQSTKLEPGPDQGLAFRCAEMLEQKLSEN